jgi:hypothetical protein
MSEEIQEGQIPRVEELDERQLERLSRNHLLISLSNGGAPLREALKRVATHYPDIPLSVRSAQKLIRRFRERGYSALLDRRFKNKRGELLFTKELQDITLAFWFARSSAGPHAIWKLVVKQCREKNLNVIGYDVIKKFLAARPEHEKLVRAGKIEVWDKQHRPVVRQQLTKYSNERWQIDHCSLPIWIREMVVVRARNRLTGEARYVWMPCRVWLTLLLDVHSRAVPGFYISKKAPESCRSKTRCGACAASLRLSSLIEGATSSAARSRLQWLTWASGSNPTPRITRR